MRYVKKLCIAGVAAVALMAVLGSGTASATVLCKVNTTPCGANKMGVGETLHSVNVGNVVFKLGFATVECAESTKEASITSSGSAATTVTANITSLTFSSCNCEVKVLTKGSLEYHWTAGHNGTETGKGTEITFSCAGTHCVYGTGAGTALGTVTGGNPATTQTNASLPRISGGFLCANPGTWIANYSITKPKPLYVMAS